MTGVHLPQNDRGTALRAEYSALRAQLHAVPAKVKAAGRAELNDTEQAEVNRLLERAKTLQAGIKAEDIKASADLMAQIQATPGFAADGARMTRQGARHMGGAGYTDDAGGGTAAGVKAAWHDLAGQIMDGGRGETRLKALTISATDAQVAAQDVVTGIQQLPQDIRYISSIFPAIDPHDALRIVDFKQTARGETGAVERDPLAVTAKAELSMTIEGITTEMRQVAILTGPVPAALLNSEPALDALLQNECSRALNKAIDQNVVANLAAATPPSGSTGATVEARVRDAISSLQALGVNPTTVVLHPDDSAETDLHTALDAYQRWPFNLRVLTSVDAIAGAPIVLDPMLTGVLYQGPVQALVDPYSGFAENTIQMRFEALMVFVVRNASAVHIAGASS